MVPVNTLPSFHRSLRACDRARRCDAHDRPVCSQSMSGKPHTMNNTNGEIIFSSGVSSPWKIKGGGLC